MRLHKNISKWSFIYGPLPEHACVCVSVPVGVYVLRFNLPVFIRWFIARGTCAMREAKGKRKGKIHIRVCNIQEYKFHPLFFEGCGCVSLQNSRNLLWKYRWQFANRQLDRGLCMYVYEYIFEMSPWSAEINEPRTYWLRGTCKFPTRCSQILIDIEGVKWRVPLA